MKAIYTPAGQAGEYAPLAANPYSGCGCMCAYCYVPSVIKMDRARFNDGATNRPAFLEALKRDAVKLATAGVRDQVMLSFTSDPYHPGDTSLTRDVLSALRDNGMSFCTLTKGGGRSLRDLDLFRREHDAFASTLTSVDDEFSARWEPRAAPASDRIAALQRFHAAGIFTWVSLEPTIDTESSLRVIEETHGFVDLFKIGRVNYLPITKRTDWESYTHRIIELCARLGVRHYIKRDLQPFLPPGYHNPMRVQQHH